jgi:hypothetical protein
MALCGQGNSARAFDVNGAIGLWARLGENADKVEDSVRSCNGAADITFVEQIGLDDLRCVGRLGRDPNIAGTSGGHAYRRATLKK